MEAEQKPVRRTASCACGALRVVTIGEPVRVHACCCLNCQKETGSALSYSAFFPEIAAAIDGDFRRWGQGMGSGHGGENCFCPTCGTRVFMRIEALAGLIGISVGCFADPAFPPPSVIYWWRRHHHWLAPPDDIPLFDTQ
jgi:hypothetical protein